MAHPLELLFTLLPKMPDPESILAVILPFTPSKMPPELSSKLKIKLEHIERVLGSNPEDISEDQLDELSLKLIAIWIKYCSLCREKEKQQEPVEDMSLQTQFLQIQEPDKQQQQTLESSSKVEFSQIQKSEPKPKQKQPTSELPLKTQSNQIQEPEPKNQKQQLSSKTQSSSPLPALVQAKPDESILKAVIPSSFPIYKYKPRNQSIFQDEENFPKNNYDKVLSTTGIRSKMHDAFYDLQIDDEYDLDGLAALLRLLSIVSKLSEPYARDYRLRYDIFECARTKLPKKMYEKVKSAIGYTRSISKLSKMLKRYITDAVNSRAMGLEEFADKRLEVCLNCFRLGHSKKICTNEALPRVIID